MSSSSLRDRSSHSAGLLLRVQRSADQFDEFYLAPGLTIGRTLANTIALPDDAAVDRTHARVEISADGAARLRCVEPDSTLTVNGMEIRELSLDSGVRFRIGRVEFECVSGRRGLDHVNLPTRIACPYCASTDVSADGEGARPCPACRGFILPVQLDPQSTRPVLLPADFHDFRANRFIARGGMGIVLKGAPARTAETITTAEVVAEPVAIKVMLPGMIGGQKDAEQFEREVATMARVRHPNVVKLMDHGRSGRFPFIVLEWIEGPCLRQVIADAGRAGKLPDFPTAYGWFEQVCKGLAAIHAVGLIHRDLKPSNILIGPDGVARIADFGIAKQLDAGQTAYTTTGHVPGTFAYMAPEQWSAPDTVDGRADLYALGVTFYELLTGSRPVGAWGPASEINPSVPRFFDEILSSLLELYREKRPGDIYELISKLGPAPRRKAPWSPWFIGLGWLFFGPIWVGGMTALNWRRLGSPRKAWRPIIIMLLAYLVGWLVSARYSEPWIPLLVLSLIQLPALGVLIYTDLLTQHRLYRAYRVSGERPGKWLKPLIFGALLLVVWAAAHLYFRNDDRAETYYRLGVTLYEKQEYDAAVAAFSEAIRLAPNSLQLYDARGHTYEKKGELEKAAADFSQIIRLDPINAVAFCNRGSIFMAKENYDSAIEDYNNSIRLDAKNSAAYSGRGYSWGQKNQRDRALADLAVAIRIDASNTEAYFRRGNVWAEGQDYDKAIVDYTEAIRLKPYAATYCMRGNAWRAKNDNDKALADYTEAVRLEPKDAATYYNRGLVWSARSRCDLPFFG